MLDYSSAIYSDFTTAFAFGLQAGSNFVQDKKSRDHWLTTKKTMADTLVWTLGFPPGVSSFLTKFGIDLENPQMNSAVEEIKNMYLNMLQTAEALSHYSQMPREEKNKKWTEPVVYKQLLSQLQSPGGKSPTNPRLESHLRLTIASELMDHLVAGTETSGWTLAYIMHELSQRPSVQSSLRRELLSLSPPIVYPAEAPDSDDLTAREALPSARAIDALPLLDAILLETLRLHAPVAGSQPRVTPCGDPQSLTSVLGYSNIPPGIRVSAQAYSLHRNPEVFPDPERWKPERWIETSEEKRSEMMRWFWAFGSGANMCLGNHLAMLGECALHLSR
jgi:cytochrome P450